jgi:hypothetical protein
MANKHPQLMLLPQPQHVRFGTGAFTLADRVPISLPPGAGRPLLVAARQLAADLAEQGIENAIARRPGNADAVAGGVALRLGKPRGGDEAYELAVRPGGIEIVGRTSRGLYYGVQTLRQLVREFGRKLPVVAIADWPEMALRGVYHDISRGRVPTVETLKYLIELLAHLKVNTFSLYIEYPFRYERHPTIWEDTRPLAADEILELDQFCQDHCIDFIPCQASFGHLARLLSKPQYRHLANTEPCTLESSRGFPRSGTSLDPTNPESIRLLADLYDEFLPQFSSPYFHACCDEVWDLGEGRSAGRAKRIGKGRLFADFICQIDRLSKKHGKRLMIWADIQKHHPDSIATIPKDVIFLNWWYYPDRQQEWMWDHSRNISRSGHELVVCPGVNNWGAFMPRTEVMRENMRLFAEAGLKYGTLGLFNTEWGDDGHFNLLGTALPGFASGAEHSWAHSKADDKSIGRRWSLQVLGDRSGDAERIVTLADSRSPHYDAVTTGFGNEETIDFEKAGTTPGEILAREQEFADRLLEACTLAQDLAPQLSGESAVAAMEWAVLSRLTLSKGAAVMARMLTLLGERQASRKLYRAAVESAADALPVYEQLWLARNYRSEIDWSLSRFRQAMARWRSAAKAK